VLANGTVVGRIYDDGLRCAAGVAIVLVGHLDLASDPGRDERHSRDARRSDGDVSGGMGISRQRHGHQQTTGWRDNCSEYKPDFGVLSTTSRPTTVASIVTSSAMKTYAEWAARADPIFLKATVLTGQPIERCTKK